MNPKDKHNEPDSRINSNSSIAAMTVREIKLAADQVDNDQTNHVHSTEKIRGRIRRENQTI